MKKYIIISAIIFAFTGSKAQVIFNPDIGQTSTSPSVLLEFGTEPKGLLLPWVTNTAGVTGAVAGTVVYDVSDKKVKYLKDGSGAGWIDLSVDATGVVNTTLQDTPTDATNAKTIIGNRTAAAPGILVLDSPTKAMVLPKLGSPYTNIINPSAGMVVYDTTTKQLAVFNGTVWSFWKPGISTVPTVTSPTGKIWMDRDLGATQVATSSTDPLAYGDFYQWGRLKDGHQIKTSPTTTTLSSGDVPGNGDFITTNTGNADWRSTSNNSLWQGVNGTNNPCPAGFRLPTDAEYTAEAAIFSSPDSAGAFASALKFPLGGYRFNANGTLMSVNTEAAYWTSNVSASSANYFFFSTYVTFGSAPRAYGLSVRCIKD